MSCYGTALRETAVAHGTLERLFSAVGTKMSSEISSLSERFLANRTLVGLFSRMGA